MLKRRTQIICRFTLEESMRLKRLADKSGYSVAAFIRERALDDKKIPVMDSKVVGKIYTELNHIGNNVNQVARLANSTKHADQETILYLLHRQDEIVRLFESGILDAWKKDGG